MPYEIEGLDVGSAWAELKKDVASFLDTTGDAISDKHTEVADNLVEGVARVPGDVKQIVHTGYATYDWVTDLIAEAAAGVTNVVAIYGASAVQGLLAGIHDLAPDLIKDGWEPTMDSIAFHIRNLQGSSDGINDSLDTLASTFEFLGDVNGPNKPNWDQVNADVAYLVVGVKEEISTDIAGLGVIMTDFQLGADYESRANPESNPVWFYEKQIAEAAIAEDLDEVQRLMTEFIIWSYANLPEEERMTEDDADEFWAAIGPSYGGVGGDIAGQDEGVPLNGFLKLLAGSSGAGSGSTGKGGWLDKAGKSASRGIGWGGALDYFTAVGAQQAAITATRETGDRELDQDKDDFGFPGWPSDEELGLNDKDKDAKPDPEEPDPPKDPIIPTPDPIKPPEPPPLPDIPPWAIGIPGLDLSLGTITLAGMAALVGTYGFYRAVSLMASNGIALPAGWYTLDPDQIDGIHYDSTDLDAAPRDESPTGIRVTPLDQIVTGDMVDPMLPVRKDDGESRINEYADDID